MQYDNSPELLLVHVRCLRDESDESNSEKTFTEAPVQHKTYIEQLTNVGQLQLSLKQILYKNLTTALIYQPI